VPLLLSCKYGGVRPLEDNSLYTLVKQSRVISSAPIVLKLFQKF